jgi:hypothetical protein
MKLGLIFENLTAFDCSQAKVTPEIAAEVRKYNSDEELLRAGGISHDALDRAAFGFAESDIKTLMPEQLKIKWKEDWIGVKWEQEKSGLSKLQYAKRIDLSEPIDVVYEKNNFYVEDGHHRLFAAKVLKKPLNVNLEIHQNPINELGVPDYDQYHRCVFYKVKNMKNERIN